MDAVAGREDVSATDGCLGDGLLDRFDHLLLCSSGQQSGAVHVADYRDSIPVLRLDLSDVHPRDRLDRVDRVDARAHHSGQQRPDVPIRVLDEGYAARVGRVDDLPEVGEDEGLEVRGRHDGAVAVRVVVSGDDRVRAGLDRPAEERDLVVHHDPGETMHEVGVQDVIHQEIPDSSQVVRKLEPVMGKEYDGFLALEACDGFAESDQTVIRVRVRRRVAFQIGLGPDGAFDRIRDPGLVDAPDDSPLVLDALLVELGQVLALEDRDRVQALQFAEIQVGHVAMQRVDHGAIDDEFPHRHLVRLFSGQRGHEAFVSGHRFSPDRGGSEKSEG